MASKAEIRAEAARLQAVFEAAGGVAVDADILQPASTLLDLYGEDIRARAFVTHDPLAGEQMLRPDFTVPVVQMHMADGAEPARYTYSGEVFRRQEEASERPSEYLQVGYEVFDRADVARSDAEVFTLFNEVLAPLNLRAATGDIGILIAAVQALSTSERRKAALLRHLWRPGRFRALLERFGGMSPVPETRTKLLQDADPLARAKPLIGLRSVDDISERIEALRADAKEPAIDAGQVALLEEILSLRANAPDALNTLNGMSQRMPGLSGAVERLATRLDALAGNGIDIASLPFEASYGRTSMEYYDGFVFGFYAGNRPDLPPVATGGRYDALTKMLGQGGSIPAVGGVIRPGLTLQLAQVRQ
ncbi:MAG: ATP phosphoribosyltransferase regulatory subunit [Marinosulfonomonas sp.]|nr:ATP phosphoribosyltransferase regulatory subunit [Marinosulfonomonas sp.]